MALLGVLNLDLVGFTALAGLLDNSLKRFVLLLEIL